MKKAEFEIFIQSFWPKKLNQNNQQGFFVLKNKINDSIHLNFNKF